MAAGHHWHRHLESVLIWWNPASRSVSNGGMRRFWLAGFLVSAAACAPAALLTAADRAALDRADAQVLEGCYDCLLEARPTYVRLAAGKARSLVLARLFEVELLLTLREKELVLDHSASLTRARDLVKELPPGLEPARYIAIVEAVPADNVGTPRAEDGEFRAAQRKGKILPRLDDEVRWLAYAPGFSQPFRQYVSLALDCMYLPRPRTVGQLPPESINRDPGPDAPPLLTYRFGICDSVKRPQLEKVRSTVPRFSEAGYFLARRELADQKHGKVRELLAESYKRFAQSPSVTYFNGNFNQLIGDCRAGLQFYDETIALKPRHENGLLGRTICLTHLKRQDEAIQAATRMIELRLDNISDAYYWRARNYHILQQLPPARADIESAKRIASNLSIFTLAGIIEYDQDDLNPADKDLNIAKGMSGSENCIARWYLGLVEMKRTRWLESGAQFEDAMTCYERSVADNLKRRAAIEKNPDLDPEFKRLQIEGFDAAIKEDRAQQYSAAFNAANHYAAGGSKDKAKTLLDIAAKEPTLAERVADLRRILGGGGG